MRSKAVASGIETLIVPRGVLMSCIGTSARRLRTWNTTRTLPHWIGRRGRPTMT